MKDFEATELSKTSNAFGGLSLLVFATFVIGILPVALYFHYFVNLGWGITGRGPLRDEPITPFLICIAPIMIFVLPLLTLTAGRQYIKAQIKTTRAIILLIAFIIFQIAWGLRNIGFIIYLVD
jgi:hypothetical protein